MSPSSSSKVYACSHQCGCDYTSRHAVAVTKHKLKGSDHRNCTPQCPSHYLLARNNIKTKTPQSTSTKQPEHQKLPVTQEPPLPNQSIHRVLEPTKRMRSCEDTDEDPTKPKKSIWESGLLSNSPTPPRQIAPRKTGVVPGSTDQRSRRPHGEENESEDEDTVEGMTIDVESDSPLSGLPDSKDGEPELDNGEPNPGNGEPDSNNQGSYPDDIGPPSSQKPRPPRVPMGKKTTNPLLSSSLQRLKSGSKSRLKLLSPPRKVMPKSITPKRSMSSTGSKQASTSSQPKTSGSIQPAIPTKVPLKTPLPQVASSNPPSPNRAQNLGSSPPKPPPNNTSVPPNTQPSPADPPNPTQPENTTLPAGGSTPPQKAVQRGPVDSIDASSNPNPRDVATVKDPNPSRVAGSEPNHNETLVESGSQPEGSPVKSPPDQSTPNSHLSDIESLYASPSPAKTVTELEPIELDSDPDFEMMERMMLSHRGPSSQSQPIKKESTIQSPVPLETKRPLKRQRGHPSPNESSQALPQTPQTDLKPAKRPRVNGPRSSDSAVVLNERRKHPEFWDLDGTVILQVDDVLFRVMRSTLSKASPWFQRLFSEERDNLEIMAGCPVYTVEEDFSYLDFANLLRGLENGLEFALNPPHYLRIASIFRAASLLEFNTLRRWSLGCIEKQWPADLPPPSKPSKFGSKIPWAGETLTIADRLDIPQLIKRVYWELCTRPEFGRVDAEVDDNEVEEIMPTRSRLSRSVLIDLTRLRERLLPEWTRITRAPPICASCARATKTPSTSGFTSAIQPTPCSLDYANWHKVISEVEVNEMTIDDRRMDPISALEVMIVEVDWEKGGGFCTECVKTWKVIWTKDREKIWKNLGDWLGLDVAAEP